MEIGPMPQHIDSPFLDLPASLVENVLARMNEVGNQILDAMRDIQKGRGGYRQQLQEKGLIRKKTDLPTCPIPTTCGTDGSYAIETLLSTNLVAAAAVAVEGLTPPKEHATWTQPHHVQYVFAEPHHGATVTAIRSLMMGEELRLATQAPHQVIFIDGSATLPIIWFNQASKVDASELTCKRRFDESFEEFVRAYIEVLVAFRSDKQYVAFPKMTTRREIGRELDWSGIHDDRALLSMILEAGEYTEPRRIEESLSEWHLPKSGKLESEVVEAIKNVHVIYYKPQSWLPAMRLEVSRAIANNSHRLATVLEAVHYQCASAGILEPYPNYMADRMAKALPRSMPAFRHAATQSVALQYEGDIGEIYSAMHGYRSEQGRKS